MAMRTAGLEGSIQVPELLQSLIDSRLDTIDRMLLGRLPRSERLEIVREVESQIFEHLQERTGGGELTREDVLDALRRLDPPEAYLPEDFGSEGAPRAVMFSTASRATRGTVATHSPAPAPRPDKNTALASGILGLCSLIEIVLQWPLIMGLAQVLSGSTVAIMLCWYLMTLTAFVTGVVAIVLAARCRLSSPWAVVGLVTGIIGILGSVVFTGIGLLGL